MPAAKRILVSGASHFGREDLKAISATCFGLVKSGIGTSHQRFGIEFVQRSRADADADGNRQLTSRKGNGNGQRVHNI